ncbi:hypothetical protein A2943_02490 [Candidatus Adlerbacteria bacterium RIFCSPLOWO2_01_FULL_51_16]|uniref:Import component protein n=1 Tax=Candidatus Adlerbacteria bacterium RIFCSPLOWO2_01_FULL_51_16 TaxID=1797243 RepID=A0A1F4XGB7_9BACT|nr:MAG: hypothetical protein A2943_02490 [Candidatus Adlerbacteria bacterium RIFCSPLOWO2_01_FULL_51_16]
MPEQHTGQKNTLMGVLCYLGPLVIISFLVAKDDPFVKYHIKQGLVLLVISAIVWVVSMTMWQFWMFYQLINLGIFILAVLGIINVVQGKEAPLPLVGQFGKHFNI